ncbi:MAG: hypothetical protein V7L20_14520 [Nostoc sp.]
MFKTPNCLIYLQWLTPKGLSRLQAIDFYHPTEAVVQARLPSER